MSDCQLSFGLWYDFRNPPEWKQNDTELYEKCIAQIARAEDMGFGDVWLSEHHFFEDNQGRNHHQAIWRIDPLLALSLSKFENGQICTFFHDV